jgi:hypothetical protein
MNIPITDELIGICTEIKDRNLLPSQWAEIESSDMFQSEKFAGGYDADEQEFCFSYYLTKDTEYWFQFNLYQALQISQGVKLKIVGINAK